MKDVAGAAGVSVATVSRVLADQDRVSAATRQAVHQACKQLGYRPDALAAALRSRSSRSVGILVPDITNPFFPAVVQTVEHELAQSALDVMLCDSGNDVAVEAKRVDTLLRRRVDALLACPVSAKGSAPALRSAARSARLLQLDRSAVEEADFVGTDQAAGMSQVVSHLRACGVRDAVFAGAYGDIPTIVERVAAFETACAAFGIATRPPADLAFPDMANGRAFARGLSAQSKLPSAIVCANDEVALGVLIELRAIGIDCPRDVLVTGFDDVPAAELMGLTTVRQPLQELGREAARLLTRKSTVPRRVRLVPSLIARATTMAAPTGSSLLA